MLSSDTFYLCRFLHTDEYLEEEAVGEELHVVYGKSAKRDPPRHCSDRQKWYQLFCALLVVKITLPWDSQLKPCCACCGVSVTGNYISEVVTLSCIQGIGPMFIAKNTNTKQLCVV